MDLQELITRGRFIFSNAPERLGVFHLVNGRRTAADTARAMKRHVNNIHRDLKRLSDAELIRPRIDKDGRPVRVKGFLVYEKSPLARTVSMSYFQGTPKAPRERLKPRKPRVAKTRTRTLRVPTEPELLDICTEGENQICEFKSAGTDARKITKEIAAMLNTRQGGMVFYGIDDSGKIHGTDVSRQQLDQTLQNSVHHSISPAPSITLESVPAMGNQILVVVVPPWNRTDVYMFDEKVLLRKGTNVLAAKSDQLRKLFRGEPVI